MAPDSCDYLVLGSGIAGLTSALRAAHGGLDVLVIEKSNRLGGTSAMSGAGIWIPANHVARAEGIADTVEEALSYIRSTAPEGWGQVEDAHWQAFANTAPRALEFVDSTTPLKFLLTNEPDPFTEAPGGKGRGRQLTVAPLSRWRIGRLSRHLRRTTLVNLINYHEMTSLDPYHKPFRALWKLWPRILWRLLANSRGQGNALITGLIRGCLDAGVRIRPKTAALQLIQGPDGRVIGAEVQTGGTRQPILAKRGVLLATGGFEWDSTLRDTHFPGGVRFLGSPSSNTGDGQKMAAEIGARMERMDQANIYPCLPSRYEGRIAGLPYTFQAEKHAILVNRFGKRFVSETDFNIGEKIDARDPDTGGACHLPVWLIADARFLRQSLPLKLFARSDRGFLIRAETVEALARKIGLPADALAQTIASYNHFCAQGRDGDFNRGQTAWDMYKTGGKGLALFPLEQGPFVAIELGRSILGTKGGARTDTRARVLHEDGSIIPGLYAAGLAMANPFGTRAIGAGTTLGPNLTWGFIAADDICINSVETH